jgi:uncharacterized membrane protein YgcG
MQWESKTDGGPLYESMEHRRKSYLQSCKPNAEWIVTIAETEAHRNLTPPPEGAEPEQPRKPAGPNVAAKRKEEYRIDLSIYTQEMVLWKPYKDKQITDQISFQAGINFYKHFFIIGSPIQIRIQNTEMDLVGATAEVIYRALSNVVLQYKSDQSVECQRIKKELAELRDGMGKTFQHTLSQFNQRCDRLRVLHHVIDDGAMTVLVLDTFTNPAFKLSRSKLAYCAELTVQNDLLVADGGRPVPIPPHLQCDWREFLAECSRIAICDPSDNNWGVKGTRSEPSFTAAAASIHRTSGEPTFGALIRPQKGHCYCCGDPNHWSDSCHATFCLCCGATIHRDSSRAKKGMPHDVRLCTPAGIALIKPTAPGNRSDSGRGGRGGGRGDPSGGAKGSGGGGASGGRKRDNEGVLKQAGPYDSSMYGPPSTFRNVPPANAISHVSNEELRANLVRANEEVRIRTADSSSGYRDLQQQSSRDRHRQSTGRRGKPSSGPR